MRDSKKEAIIVRGIKHAMLKTQCEEYGYSFCQACGRNQHSTILDASHLIPRSRSIELITKRDNIFLHCRNCHKKWERNDYTMPKYDTMMGIVKLLDEQYFYIRLQKLPVEAQTRVQEYIDTVLR